MKEHRELLKKTIITVSKYSDRQLKYKYSRYSIKWVHHRFEVNLNSCSLDYHPIDCLYFESISVAIFASAILEEIEKLQNDELMKLFIDAADKISKYDKNQIKKEYHRFESEFYKDFYRITLNQCAYGGCPIQFLYFRSESESLFASAILEEIRVEFAHNIINGYCPNIKCCSGIE